jgi:hypothetical protein
MALLRKLLHIVGFVSFALWSTLLLAVFLPTTGLLATNPSETISGLMLDIFRVSGFVASVTCLVINLEMLGIFTLVQQKSAEIHTSLMNSRNSNTS